MDKGAWQATIHGVAKESDMTEQLNSNNKVLLLLLLLFFNKVLLEGLP